MRPGTVAVTMAGLGTRFSRAGYTSPKYEIPARGRSLFDWSMAGLSAFRDAGWTFSFATLAAHRARPFLEGRCTALGIVLGTIVELDTLTDGQATTALHLAGLCDTQAPFAIFNIDTFLRPGAVGPQDGAGLEGFVPCFPGPGDGWSFVRLDGDGHAAELREKTRISEHATVGLYGFASAGLFIDAYAGHFADGNGEEKGERYVAPIYNRLIARGARIGVPLLALGDVGMLGTPEQVAAFEAAPPPGARALLDL